MKNLKSKLLLVIAVFTLTFFSSCNENGGLLGQTPGFGANEALLNHAIPTGSALNTNQQAYKIDYSQSRWGLVGIRAQWGDVDLNYFMTTITMFVGPTTIVPPGATTYIHPKYQVKCFDALAAVEYSSAGWSNFGTAVSSLTGGADKLVVDLTVDYFPQGFAVTDYDLGTMKAMTRYSNGVIAPAVSNAKIAHYLIRDATTFKYK